MMDSKVQQLIKYNIKCVENVTLTSDQDRIIDKRNEKIILNRFYVNVGDSMYQAIKKHYKHIKNTT